MATLIPSEAGLLDITLDQGADRTIINTWKDSEGALMDLTGYTGVMQIRETKSGTEALLELTTENGGLAMGGVAGTITMVFTDTQTAALDFDEGTYDLLLYDSTMKARRLLQGKIINSKSTTRP